jgi:hypothetical protein
MVETLVAFIPISSRRPTVFDAEALFRKMFHPCPNTYLRSEESNAMTKEQKQEYNRNFCKRKRAQGWRFFGFVLPPMVAERVLNFKRREMARYRGQRMEA